jgi:hypothetical protein
MLHLVHMIERRYGPARGRQWVVRIAIASLLLLALGAGLAMSLPARAQAIDGKAIATRALDHMDAGEYAQAEAMFNADMAKAVPADKLKAVWESLPAQVGKAGGRGDAQSMQQDTTTLVQVPLHFEKAELVAKFAIDADGRIAGFMIQPAQAAAPPATPGGGRGRELSAKREVPGSATAGPRPAGDAGDAEGRRPVRRRRAGARFGPAGPRRAPSARTGRCPGHRPRPGRTQGIAVLRYEKRTRARPQEFASGVRQRGSRKPPTTRCTAAATAARHRRTSTRGACSCWATARAG